MAHPKRQHSTQRTRKRRTHCVIKAAETRSCSHCARQIVSHRVCPFCGYYKGNMVVDMTPKTANA